MMTIKLPHVLLHLGGNKTGTTAIQSAFSRNRDALRNLGILYPDLKIIDEATRSHWPLAAAVMNRPSEYYLYKDRGLDEAASADLSQQMFSELERQLAETRWKKVVISTEALSMLQPSELLRLRRYMQSRFEKISAVYLGREPVAGAISFYQQALVGGGNVPFERLVESQNFMFGAASSKLSAVFKDDLILRVFNKNDFINGDIITDFLVRYLELGEAEAATIQQSPDVNISLSAASAALLYYLNKVSSRREDGARNPVFFAARRFVKEYDRARRPPKLSFPDERWNAYIRRAMNEDWLLFLMNAKLIEEVDILAEQIKREEVEFNEVEPPTRRDIEVWMRRENLAHLDRSSLPPDIRVQFSAGLSRKG